MLSDAFWPSATIEHATTSAAWVAQRVNQILNVFIELPEEVDLDNSQRHLITSQAMSATERLYYNDSRLLEFDARVVDLDERDDGAVAVVLDRTAFYPTGGGQPNDTGTLGEARVVDCIDAEDEGVLHVIQGPTPEIGDTVHGKIDWLRRLDHIQQHTGQHILSAAFVNQSNWESRPIQISSVMSQDAASLPLRKEPARVGELRVVEVNDFDLTPCGGTHARSTGEVGVIAVRSWERAKGLTRIQFMAGIRVLRDFRKANQTAVDVATL